MASVRKKYNHAAKTKQINALRENNAKKVQALKIARADKKIRDLLKGATIAYNSLWETELKEGEEGRQVIYTSGLERLKEALNGDSETAFGATLEIVMRWRVYITINNVTQDGEQYLILLPVVDRADQMLNILFDIQNNIIPAELKKRNHAHLVDWGYWGEVI